MKILDLLLEAFSPDHEAIIKLVVGRRVITVYYKGDKENAAGWRTIEPVAYGERKGVKYLRAWQRKGKTTTFVPGWKFFRLDRLRNWNISSLEVFDKIRPGYNTTGDKHLPRLFAIAKFGNDKKKEPSVSGTATNVATKLGRIKNKDKKPKPSFGKSRKNMKKRRLRENENLLVSILTS